MSTGGRSSMGGSEEVIQIEGSVQQCVAALRGVATLLRGWQIRRVMTTQQGAMQMQQGGYGSGFPCPPPMAGPQQVPMSPTSTGGVMSGPMSPTSPGAWWWCWKLLLGWSTLAAACTPAVPACIHPS